MVQAKSLFSHSLCGSSTYEEALAAKAPKKNHAPHQEKNDEANNPVSLIFKCSLFRKFIHIFPFYLSIHLSQPVCNCFQFTLIWVKIYSANISTRISSSFQHNSLDANSFFENSQRFLPYDQDKCNISRFISLFFFRSPKPPFFITFVE